MKFATFSKRKYSYKMVDVPRKFLVDRIVLFFCSQLYNMNQSLCKVYGGQSATIGYIFYRNASFLTRHVLCISLYRITPPKTNMEPENGPLEKEIPFGNHPFQVPAISFRGCILYDSFHFEV